MYKFCPHQILSPSWGLNPSMIHTKSDIVDEWECVIHTQWGLSPGVFKGASLMILQTPSQKWQAIPSSIDDESKLQSQSHILDKETMWDRVCGVNLRPLDLIIFYFKSINQLR